MNHHGAPGSELANIDSLSIAVMGPGDYLRRLMTDALSASHHGEVQEFPSYPALSDIPHQLNPKFDCIVIELDSDPEYVLQVIQTVSADAKSTVMVYSRMSESEIGDPDLLTRCMRMGAREFISLPFSAAVITDALRRAALRRAAGRESKKATGRLFIFCGTKGGVGVTNIACNFAIALAKQADQKTLLVDLDIPLGDTALNLGIRPPYSTLDALENWNRLDPSFLSKLLVWHESGLAVLPAPGQFSTRPVLNEAIEQLLKTARESFENVVVDSGAKLDLANGCTQFRDATKVYLVTQSGIPELRNANRLITRYMGVEGLHLEIVLNRYEPGRTGISDEDIRKALTRDVTWRIPNDYRVVREMQDTSAPIIGTDSLIARRIDDMVRSICGLPQLPAPTKGFSFKGLFKRSATKLERSPLSATPLGIGWVNQPGDASEPGGNEATGDRKKNVNRRVPDETQEPSTRVYEGRIYERAEDGSWQISSAAPAALQPAIAIEWTSPDPITYGTALSKSQCNAKASVPGAFRYMPGEGIVLPAGGHSLWLTFIPDGEPSLEVHASTEISVMKASAEFQWPMPSAIPQGTALGTCQLNATASIPGTFEYVPGPGEVLKAGLHCLKAHFTPEDSNYMHAQVQVPLAVLEAGSPLISWGRPADIAYGTPLSAVQLNAASSLPGQFSYSPDEGTILPPGDHSLSVVFIPRDPGRLSRAQANVQITVKGKASFGGPVSDSVPRSLRAAYLSPRWNETVHDVITGIERGPEEKSAPASIIQSEAAAPAPAETFPAFVTRTMSMIAWRSKNDSQPEYRQLISPGATSEPQPRSAQNLNGTTGTAGSSEAQIAGPAKTPAAESRIGDQGMSRLSSPALLSASLELNRDDDAKRAPEDTVQQSEADSASRSKPTCRTQPARGR